MKTKIFLNTTKKLLIKVTFLLAIVLATLSCKKEDVSITEEEQISSSTNLKADYVNTDTWKESNFDNGSLLPFETNCTTNGNYVKVVTARLKMYWAEANYLGTRDTKSAEIWSTMSTYDHVWAGFKLYVPSSAYPYDKDAILAQFMQRTDAIGSSTWCGVFEMINNNLYFVYRGYNGTVHTTKTVKSSFPRDTWVEIIYHIDPRTDGASDGTIQIWYNGTQVVNVNGTAYIGWGTYSNTQKFGMYNADAANYTDNETRTIYMDDIGVYDGNTSGYSKVDP